MLQPAIDLADHGSAVTLDLDPRDECALRPAKKGGQHLAGLVAVVVDGLLADKDKARLLARHDFLEKLGDGERLDLVRRLDMNAAIGTHGKCRTDCFLILARAD